MTSYLYRPQEKLKKRIFRLILEEILCHKYFYSGKMKKIREKRKIIREKRKKIFEKGRKRVKKEGK